MSGTVRVRQAIGTVGVSYGTEQWVPDSDLVDAMCAAGFWQVVERRSGRSRAKSPVAVPEADGGAEEVQGGGAVAVEPDGVPG